MILALGYSFANRREANGAAGLISVVNLETGRRTHTQEYTQFVVSA